MNFLKIFADNFQDFWDLPAVSNYETGLTLTYGTIASRMRRIHMLLEGIGAGVGSRVAVIGRNSVDWVTNYMAGITFGATVISLPVTYTIGLICRLLGQAGAEYVFMDPELFPGEEALLDMPSVRLVISMDSQRVLARRQCGVYNPQQILDDLDIEFVNKYPYGFNREDAGFPYMAPGAISAIFFTAGTTDYPKPVMLMADNLEGNVIYGIKTAMLPRGTTSITATNLGNAWSTVYNLLVPLASGAHLTIFSDLDNVPSFIEAMRKIKPQRLMMSPHRLADLYIAARHHASTHGVARLIGHPSHLEFINNMALKRAFRYITGGHCHEIIIFADALGPNLAYRMRRAGINVTVGYGLVECGGLISYSPHNEYTSGTSGRTINNIVKCRLRPIDMKGLPEGAGYLEVKGMTVMKGYVDEKINKEVFTKDGWFRTGDIAVINAHNELTIIGRRSTVIKLNGYAIIPERLALLLMDMPHVKQAIIVEHDGGLTAVVHPNLDTIRHELGETADPVNVMRNALADLNRITGLHEHVDNIEVSMKPLIKTPKGTVARFLYLPPSTDQISSTASK